MAPTTLAEKLSELLGLPVEVIRAYGKPRTSSGSIRAQKFGTVIEKGQRSSRLMTIREGAGEELFSTTEIMGSLVRPIEGAAEEATASERDEDVLYRRWCDAPDGEKREIESQLFNVVVKHALAVMIPILKESDQELARDIASAAIEGMGRFRGQAKFSTWVHQIALNKTNLKLRRMINSRKRFADYEEHKDGPSAPISTAVLDDVETGMVLDRLKRELPARDYALIEYKLDNLSTKDAGEKLGMSEDAAESQLRRVRARLKKKMLVEPRRKMTTSGN